MAPINYTKARADWKSGRAGGTLIRAADLDTIEAGVKAACDGVDGLGVVYLGISAKAADAELLDGHDSAYFATADHIHTGAAADLYNPYAYLIYQSGGTIYAINGQTGEADYSGADFATVFNQLVTALNAGAGGRILIRPGYYSVASSITPRAHIDVIGLSSTGDELGNTFAHGVVLNSTITDHSPTVKFTGGGRFHSQLSNICLSAISDDLVWTVDSTTDIITCTSHPFLSEMPIYIKKAAAATYPTLRPGQNFTAVAATDICTLSGHGYTTGDVVCVHPDSGGLNDDEAYYINRIDDDTFYLYDSYVNAVGGTATGRVNITSNITGTACYIGGWSAFTTSHVYRAARINTDSLMLAYSKQQLDAGLYIDFTNTGSGELYCFGPNGLAGPAISFNQLSTNPPEGVGWWTNPESILTIDKSYAPSAVSIFTVYYYMTCTVGGTVYKVTWQTPVEDSLRTLSGSDYNTVTCNQVTGATAYKLYCTYYGGLTTGKVMDIDPATFTAVYPTVDTGDPLDSTTTYFVKYVSDSTFQIALTKGGAAITFSDAGTGPLLMKRWPDMSRYHVFTVDAGTDILTCTSRTWREGEPVTLCLGFSVNDTGTRLSTGATSALSSQLKLSDLKISYHPIGIYVNNRPEFCTIDNVHEFGAHYYGLLCDTFLVCCHVQASEFCNNGIDGVCVWGGEASVISLEQVANNGNQYRNPYETARGLRVGAGMTYNRFEVMSGENNGNYLAALGTAEDDNTIYAYGGSNEYWSGNDAVYDEAGSKSNTRHDRGLQSYFPHVYTREITPYYSLDDTAETLAIQKYADSTESNVAVIGADGGATGLRMYDSLVFYGTHTLEDDATPSVKGYNLFKTGGTTTITDFDDGVVGQEIAVLAAHTVTIDDNGTNIILAGNVDWTMNAGDTLTLKMFIDQQWHEVARSDNT